MVVDANDPPLGAVYAVPLSGLKSAPGRWGVVQVVSTGINADLGQGPIEFGRPWGPTVVGFDAAFDEVPSLDEVGAILQTPSVIVQTVITFAHSDRHWVLLGPSSVQVTIPVPLFGQRMKIFDVCHCVDIVRGKEFETSFDDCKNVYGQSQSTAPMVSDALIMGMELEPEYTELKSTLVNPAMHDGSIIGRFRELEL